MSELPFAGAYWADPGRLLAGPYPADYHPHDTRRNLQRLLAAGVRTVVSLMEAREDSQDPSGRPPYVDVLDVTARRLGVDCDWHRFAIHDMSVPDTATMQGALTAIERSLAADRPVYAHCWGGRGRTGTIVGAYLIQRGLATPENFVEVISGLRGPGTTPSPETAEQVDFVRRFVGRRAS